jgi:DNA-binding MarR family transcriptional regulator
MMMSTPVPEIEHKIYAELIRRGDAAPPDVRELAASIGEDQSRVSAALQAMEAAGNVEIRTRTERFVRLGDSGRKLAQRFGGMLPERHVLCALLEHGPVLSLAAVAQHAEMEPDEVGSALRRLKQKGWATQQGRELTLTAAGRAAFNEDGDAIYQEDERLFSFLVWREVFPAKAATAMERAAMERDGLIRCRDGKVALTSKGQAVKACVDALKVAME